MLTPLDFKNIITNNLTDQRIFSIQAFITRLIDRKTFGGGVEQYRIYDKTTATYVTSLADFITKLDVNSIIPDYFYNADKMTGDRIHPIAINLTNFVIRLNINSDEDNYYHSVYGAGALDNKSILLLANYISDGDLVLPIKLYEIRLITVNK